MRIIQHGNLLLKKLIFVIMNFKNLKIIFISTLLISNVSYIYSKSIVGKLNITRNNAFVDERDVNLKITFKVNIVGCMNQLRLKLTVPKDIANRQKVRSLSYSIKPDNSYSVNSANYVVYNFKNVEKSFKINLKCNLTIYNSINKNNQDIETDLSKYLVAEKDIESDSPTIMETAAKLKKNTDIETVVNSFNYVKDNIRYELKKAIGAEKVLETGVGKCMDFSDLLVALCRANKIPAKSVFGIVVDEDAENPLHAWPEVYLKRQGWVLFDPTTGHSEVATSGKNFLLDVENKYITLSEGRNDPEFKSSPYVIYFSTEENGTVKVDIDFHIMGQ